MNFDWTSFFNSEYWSKLIWILNLIIISIVVYFLVGQAFRFWLIEKIEPQVSISSKQSAIKEKSQDKERSLEYFQIIAQRNLFGGNTNPQSKDKASEKNQKLKIEDIPLAQSIQLKLVGTIVGSNSVNNRAIITDGKQSNQSIYRQGDQIQDMIIKQILRNKIVINNGKKDQILLMEMDKVTDEFEQNTSAKSHSGSDTTTIDLDREFVQNSVQNMVELMKKVRIVPYEDKQGNKGFQLLHLKNESFFNKLGLKSKDVLIKVNGESLESPQKVLQFYNKLQNMEKINLEVKRNDSLQNFEYNIF